MAIIYEKFVKVKEETNIGYETVEYRVSITQKQYDEAPDDMQRLMLYIEGLLVDNYEHHRQFMVKHITEEEPQCISKVDPL
jgi:hypothetical protein